MKSRSILIAIFVSAALSGCLKTGNPNPGDPTLSSSSRSGGIPVPPGPALGGGDGVSNGGGLGEKNLIFAFYSLGDNLLSCLQSTNCNLSSEDAEIVRRIISALTRQVENIDGIIFKSEDKTPGFFIQAGRLRSAITGTKPGDPIYINTNHLYAIAESGAHRPITVIESTSLLTHELAHHQGIGSSDPEMRRLDLLTAKISHFLAVPKSSLARRVTDLRPHFRGGARVFFCEPSIPTTEEMSWIRIRFEYRDGITRYLADIGKNPAGNRASFWTVPVLVTGTEQAVEIRSDATALPSFVLNVAKTNEARPPVIPGINHEALNRFRAHLSQPRREVWRCQVAPDILNADNPLWVLFLR